MNTKKGKILKGIGGFYYVKTDTDLVECRARGLFRNKDVLPYVGDNVEIGCNTVLCPGTVIGKNTNIYPLSMVRGYVEENSIYKNKNEIIKKR